MAPKEHALLLFAALTAIFIVAFVLAIYFSLIAIRNRKPGVELPPGQRPINILFRPHDLTDKGLTAQVVHHLLDRDADYLRLLFYLAEC